MDSDWLVDALVGIRPAVDLVDALTSDGVGISIVSYGELFEGAVGAPDAERELARFRAFLNRLTTIPLSDPVMEVFARTRARLRATGRLIPDLDLLIASTAVHHELTLVTRNRRHFERIPGLVLYQP